MKFLYCILVICVAANAEPVPQTREQLKDTANLILQSIQDGPKSIEKAIFDCQLTVFNKLLGNELVQKLKNTLFEKLDEDTVNESTEKCIATTVQQYEKLVPIVTDDLLQKLMTERYGKTDDYLNSFKKELSELKNVLENHADEEIDSCLNGKSSCRLNDEFLSKSEEYFRFEDLIKPVLLSSVKSSDEFFNSLEVGNKIVVNLTHPTYECLENAKN